jgi:TPR repeat protein
MRGWVYIISNQAMPDLLKVGFSMKDPHLRAREFDGTGVPHSYQVEWDILLDNPRDVEQLAHRHLANFKEAKEWFRCSVVEAIQAVKRAASGNFHYSERGGPKKIDELPFPFEINDPDLAYELSDKVLDGVFDDEDVIDKEHPKSWQKYFDRAIQLNSIDAWLGVAYSLASGTYKKRDSSIFVSYKPDISESEAQNEADQIFERIFPIFLERAQSGDINAANTVGKLYFLGLGISKDEKKAIYWISKSATKDDGSAALDLAVHYKLGKIGGSVNLEEAFKWYQVSAHRGSFAGAAGLACAYRDGRGVSANIDAAKLWAQRAYEMNSAAAGKYWNIADLLDTAKHKILDRL